MGNCEVIHLHCLMMFSTISPRLNRNQHFYIHTLTLQDGVSTKIPVPQQRLSFSTFRAVLTEGKSATIQLKSSRYGRIFLMSTLSAVEGESEEQVWPLLKEARPEENNWNLVLEQNKKLHHTKIIQGCIRLSQLTNCFSVFSLTMRKNYIYKQIWNRCTSLI